MAGDSELERTHFTAHISIKKVVRRSAERQNPSRMHNPTPDHKSEREIIDLSDFSIRSEQLDALKGRLVALIELTEDD
jgi:hypothetical protein